MPILEKKDRETIYNKYKDSIKDIYHTNPQGIIDRGPYMGLSLEDARELNAYQREEYYKQRREAQKKAITTSIKAATDNIARNYIVPTAKFASFFTPVSWAPVIVDAAMAFKSGKIANGTIGTMDAASTFMDGIILKKIGGRAAIGLVKSGLKNRGVIADAVEGVSKSVSRLNIDDVLKPLVKKPLPSGKELANAIRYNPLINKAGIEKEVLVRGRNVATSTGEAAGKYNTYILSGEELVERLEEGGKKANKLRKMRILMK